MTPESIPTSEVLHTEFKAAKRALPKNLFGSICAFLNTDGKELQKMSSFTIPYFYEALG